MAIFSLGSYTSRHVSHHANWVCPICKGLTSRSQHAIKAHLRKHTKGKQISKDDATRMVFEARGYSDEAVNKAMDTYFQDKDGHKIHLQQEIQ